MKSTIDDNGKFRLSVGIIEDHGNATQRVAFFDPMRLQCESQESKFKRTVKTLKRQRPNYNVWGSKNCPCKSPNSELHGQWLFFLIFTHFRAGARFGKRSTFQVFLVFGGLGSKNLNQILFQQPPTSTPTPNPNPNPQRSDPIPTRSELQPDAEKDGDFAFGMRSRGRS
eukprot:g75021.t1